MQKWPKTMISTHRPKSRTPFAARLKALDIEYHPSQVGRFSKRPTKL
jgi:hypothetical protein